MIQTCLSGIVRAHLDLVRSAPALAFEDLVEVVPPLDHLPVAVHHHDRVVIAALPSALLGSASHVALRPSPLPVALPRVGCSSAYGVHGFAPAGSGSSPRCAIQIRSGVSAYTAPTDPHVQPSCFTPSAAVGQRLAASRARPHAGPVSSWPPFSWATAGAAPPARWSWCSMETCS